MAIALIVHFVLIQDHQVSISGAKFGHVISDICKSKLGQTPGSIGPWGPAPPCDYQMSSLRSKGTNLALEYQALANLSFIKHDQGPPCPLCPNSILMNSHFRGPNLALEFHASARARLVHWVLSKIADQWVNIYGVQILPWNIRALIVY